MNKVIHLAKIIFLILVLLLTLFWLSPAETKLQTFSKLEKYWARIRPSKPSSFIDLAVLKEKLAKGLPTWAKAQIETDLAHFKVITTAELDEYYETYNSEHNKLVRFQIKNGEIHTIAKDKNLLESRAYKIMVNVLQYITKQGFLSDTDFILSLQDYAILPKDKTVPIFTFSKDTSVEGEKDLILIPDWMNLRSRAELKPRIRYANFLFPMQNKKDKVFWRGSLADSTGFRHKLVKLSKNYPDKIDAVFSQDNPKEYVSEEQHVPYKYQITIDGARGTWERFVWQLQANCLIFKQNSYHVQWFYKGVNPNEHYIPIAVSSAHPAETQLIINHAMDFAENNLALEDMYHYMIVLLQKYNQNLKT